MQSCKTAYALNVFALQRVLFPLKHFLCGNWMNKGGISRTALSGLGGGFSPAVVAVED